MMVIDLFSGLGGWSAAFKDRGHEVFTVDIDPEFNPDLLADILTVTPSMLPPDPDVVLASPPCTEFTRAGLPWYDDPDPPSMDLVWRTTELIGELNPKWWALENVRGSVPYIKPLLGDPVMIGAQYLWGVFPIMNPTPKRFKYRTGPCKNRAAVRAIIPYNISMALCMAVEREMEVE